MMDIEKRYSVELNAINNRLADLERGHIHEITGTPGTPSCAKLANDLRKSIGELLYKIENDEPSITQKVAKATKNI